jgi:hypothetical protein
LLTSVLRMCCFSAYCTSLLTQVSSSDYPTGLGDTENSFTMEKFAEVCCTQPSSFQVPNFRAAWPSICSTGDVLHHSGVCFPVHVQVIVYRHKAIGKLVECVAVCFSTSQLPAVLFAPLSRLHRTC